MCISPPNVYLNTLIDIAPRAPVDDILNTIFLQNTLRLSAAVATLAKDNDIFLALEFGQLTTNLVQRAFLMIMNSLGSMESMSVLADKVLKVIAGKVTKGREKLDKKLGRLFI